jgi:xanthine dehydrogenase accessory factor
MDRLGLAVVLVDEADPAWHRRGMAFTDAWYIGNAELQGKGACFCASLKSIPSVLARGMFAATTWSWPSVARSFLPEVLVDARRRSRRGTDALLGQVPLTIGIGPDFVANENVDLAIARCGATAGEGDAEYARDRTDHAGAGRQGGIACTVDALRHGRFVTERRIGDDVGAGEIVGGLGSEAIAAPASGVLSGLAARGARIEPGDTLVEIDPDGIAHRCYGVDEASRRIAEVVVTALAARQGAGHESGSRDGAGGASDPPATSRSSSPAMKTVASGAT